MATEWIKMKRGLRHDPKVIAISRQLAADPAFMAWLEPNASPKNVTQRVTFANVTRVTVCALLDVWAALNNSITTDCRMPYMALQDIDDIAEVPGIGAAMASVGWVVQKPLHGLVFPNFIEHNTPAKSRENTQTNAQRQKAYRGRKKAESDKEKALRYVTTDKNREEKSNKEERESASAKAQASFAEQAQTIVSAYPRREKIADALQIVHGHLQAGDEFECMLAGTKAAAAVIRNLPSASANRYVPGALSFFQSKRWADDPETLRRQGNSGTGAKPTSKNEFLDELGGRAPTQ